MTTQEQLITARLHLCFGYRDGKEGLLAKARLSNRMPAPLKEQILLQTRRNPFVSYIRLAREMRSEGGSVTPTIVRYVW
jgi:hypothetical protein